MSFFEQLQQASLGGVPFGVLGASSHFGRRIAVHEYPFRDTPWAEDIGKATRRFEIMGFLLENDAIYKGADVISQRDAMIAVAESAGPLTLVHPTLGRLTVSLLEIAIEERWDAGRYFEIVFRCVESGQRLLPSTGTDTQSAVGSAISGVNAAASKDFLVQIQGAINQGRSVISMAVNTVNNYVVQAVSIANDATALYGMVAQLPGVFGRFAGGALSGFMNTSKPYNGAVPTIPSLIATGSANRAAVASGGAQFSADSAAANWSVLGADSQALAVSVLAATVDPADGVRLMAEMVNFYPSTPTVSSSIGQAMSLMQTSIGNICRRSAVSVLAQACSTYQPSSGNDAVTVRNLVTGLLDAEIQVAGDNGEDATFQALRALRQAVVQDLNRRGAQLARMENVSFGASMPAAVIALRLYRDAGRGDEVAQESNAPHPSFQPLSFQVLAS